MKYFNQVHTIFAGDSKFVEANHVINIECQISLFAASTGGNLIAQQLLRIRASEDSAIEMAKKY